MKLKNDGFLIFLLLFSVSCSSLKNKIELSQDESKDSHFYADINYQIISSSKFDPAYEPVLVKKMSSIVERELKELKVKKDPAQNSAHNIVRLTVKWHLSSPSYKYYVSLFSLFIVPLQLGEKVEVIADVYKNGNIVKSYTYDNRMLTTLNLFLLPALPFVDSPNEARDSLVKDLLAKLVKDVRTDYPVIFSI